jgi:hypothetical protein
MPGKNLLRNAEPLWFLLHYRVSDFPYVKMRAAPWKNLLFPVELAMLGWRLRYWTRRHVALMKPDVDRCSRRCNPMTRCLMGEHPPKSNLSRTGEQICDPKRFSTTYARDVRIGG